MIRKLNEADCADAVTLLRQDPIGNLYFLGNIAAIGFHADYCEFWGDFSPTGRLHAVLNRYRSGWIVYGSAAADWAALGTVVDTHPVTAERLQDNPGGVDSFLPYLHRYQASWIREEESMVLDAAAFTPSPPPEDVVVRRATEADLPALVAFYGDAGEMSRTPAGVEEPLRRRRIWLAERAGTICAGTICAGTICSVALTNAETADRAMIGGVFTPPAQRSRGYSQAVVSALCAELLSERKQPVLYWENPAAGAIYRKLGFRAVGTWRSVRLQPIERG